MGNAFDIRRRRRSRYLGSPGPTRRQKRSFTTFLFLIALAALIIIMNGRVATQSPIPTSPPPSTIPTSISSSTTVQVTPTITPTDLPTSTLVMPTITATPTTTPTIDKTSIDKASISISILNGSGIAGQANTLRTQLEGQGFNVRRIAVAATRKESIIYYQPGKRAEAELVASYIPERVLAFEENSDQAGKDTLLIILGQK